ncbi:16745_t:CDS:1, partial [Racocetra fulgida]
NGDWVPKITNVTWTRNRSIKLTLQSPRKVFPSKWNAPTAIGHYTLDDQKGNYQRFAKKAYFINGYNDTNVWVGDSYVGSNPATVESFYDNNFNPQLGSLVRVAISIYYRCTNIKDDNWYSSGIKTVCSSCDVEVYAPY